MKYEGVIFDLDGTLIDSMWIWHQIDIDFLKKRNIELKEKLSVMINGMSFLETANYFIEKFSLDESPHDIMKEWLNMAEYHYLNDIPLKEFAVELLNLLKELKIKIALGTSNKQPLVNQVLKRFNILNFFEIVRTSDEVKAGKPNPDLFNSIAKDLGIENQKIIVFEDSLAGVIAARNANMDVCAVFDEHAEPHKEEIIELSDFYIHSLNECKRFLFK